MTWFVIPGTGRKIIRKAIKPKMFPAKRIAVFGSAFNPPHFGHLDVIRQCESWADLIILVPSYAHAFGKEMALFSQRMQMVEALLNKANKSSFKKEILVSNIEQSIAKEKSKDNASIYTFDVLEAFEKIYPCDQLFFVMGPDNAKPDTWNKFYKASEIEERWNIWTAKENLSIRSTNIRTYVEACLKTEKKLSIEDNKIKLKLELESMCPRSIIELIFKFKLYTNMNS